VCCRASLEADALHVEPRVVVSSRVCVRDCAKLLTHRNKLR
jgi:hypothetical protein